MIDRSPADRKVLCSEHFVRVLLVLGVPASQLGFPTEVAALPLSGFIFCSASCTYRKKLHAIVVGRLEASERGSGDYRTAHGSAELSGGLQQRSSFCMGGKRQKRWPQAVIYQLSNCVCPEISLTPAPAPTR